MIKFVIPSKENDEQIKSNLKTSIYCKICLVVYTTQDELRSKSTGIIHNELIMQWEDYWQLQSIVLGCSLNLLVKEVNVARLIILLCNR